MITFKDVEGEFQHHRIMHQGFWLEKNERTVFPSFFFFLQSFSSVDCKQDSIEERAWALEYVRCVASAT